jgi:ABC-type Fe3+ transport system substrate-binding protein
MREETMYYRLLMSTATAACGTLAFLAAAQAQEIGATFDEILAAAMEEDPVQWCTGMGPDESGPLVDGFVAAFPGVPRPNDFECFGEASTQRVVSEWVAGVSQADILDMDTEILESLEQDNLSFVFDWSVFDGTAVEVPERHRRYNGRIITVGTGFRVIWYNPSLVSAEDAPKSWEDCADPKYAGMLAMDVRPTFYDMMEEIGGPWTDVEVQEWARGVAANEPMWVRGTAQTYQVLSSGERGIICGIQLHGLFRDNRTVPNDPAAPVTFIIPKEVLAYEYLRLGLAPDLMSPNATVLFTAWMGSNDGGQRVIGEVNPGYASPFIEGSFTQAAIAAAGAELLMATEEAKASVSDRLNELVLTEWGFPTAAE